MIGIAQKKKTEHMTCTQGDSQLDQGTIFSIKSQTVNILSFACQMV